MGYSSIVLSLYSELYNIDPSIYSYKDFNTKIRRMKLKGQYVQSKTLKLQNALNDISNDQEFSRKVSVFCQMKSLHEISNTFATFFKRILEDNSLKLETNLEDITETDMIAEKEKEELKNDEEIFNESEGHNTSNLSQIEKDSGNVILNANFILAPVDGKHVTKLKKGDMVLIKILNTSQKANYFIDSLKLKKDDQIIPVPAKVISIDMYTGKAEVLTQVQDNVYGRIIEEENILIKMYHGEKILPDSTMANIQAISKETDEKDTQKEIASKNIEVTTKEKRAGMFMLYSGVITVILFFLLIYFLLSP